MTSKDDKCRLLHLYCEPRLMVQWQHCLDSQDRPNLDAGINPYDTIAEAFNDYDQYAYTNLGLNTSGGPLNDELVCMHSYICKLNPCDESRSSIVRDGKWVKDTFSTLRGKITEIRARFKASGNHSNANPYMSWMQFTNDDVVLYSKIILPDGMMNQLGRALPDEVQIDTCDIVDESERISEFISENKKRHRDQRAVLTRKKESKDDVTSILKRVAENQMSTSLASQQLDTLKFLFQHGDPVTQQRAYDKMLSIAFGQPTNGPTSTTSSSTVSSLPLSASAPTPVSLNSRFENS